MIVLPEYIDYSIACSDGFKYFVIEESEDYVLLERINEKRNTNI